MTKRTMRNWERRITDPAEWPEPTIARLARAGVIWRDDDGCLVGRAADGVEVSFGDDPKTVERYLADRPNPEQW